MQRDESPEIWSPKRVGGATKGVGASTVAMETAAHSEALCTESTRKSRWSKRYRERTGEKGEGGRGKKYTGETR